MDFDLEQYVEQRLRHERRDRILGWIQVTLFVFALAGTLFEDQLKAWCPALAKPIITLPWHHK